LQAYQNGEYHNKPKQPPQALRPERKGQNSVQEEVQKNKEKKEKEKKKKRKKERQKLPGRIRMAIHREDGLLFMRQPQRLVQVHSDSFLRSKY
jgi:hypothetical protein